MGRHRLTGSNLDSKDYGQIHAVVLSPLKLRFDYITCSYSHKDSLHTWKIQFSGLYNVQGRQECQQPSSDTFLMTLSEL